MRDPRDHDHGVLLYDLEDYAGAGWAPRYKRGDIRFFLNAYTRLPGALFHSLIWTASAHTLEEARAKVPLGGVYFDRTRNWPSPMVPIEGWYFEREPERPAKTMAEVAP